MISDELRAANSAGAIATGLLALKIPVPLTTVQWADRHYYLPKESSYTPGRWETLPFQVAIMNSMGNDRIRTVNLIKSARVGYTRCCWEWRLILLSINHATAFFSSPRILLLKIL